jgi:predicted RNA-binding Zn-ribbon protein involved in translation (DUF1610 family)
MDANLYFFLVIFASLCVEFGAAWGIISLQLHPRLRTYRISNLPNLSGHFLKWLESKKHEQWTTMPCPRCGHRSVQARSGSAILGSAGVRSLVIYLFVLTALGYAVSLLMGFTISLIITGAGLLVLIFMPQLKVPLGQVYRCPSCSLAWTYSEIIKILRRNPEQANGNRMDIN